METKKVFSLRLAPRSIEKLKIAATRLDQAPTSLAARIICDFADVIVASGDSDPETVHRQRKKPAA